MLRYTLAVLLAGAVGNLIDRLFFGEVVDFLAFQFGSYHFPNFNIADSAICLSAAFLIYLLLFRRQELHDLESLFTEDQDAKRA